MRKLFFAVFLVMCSTLVFAQTGDKQASANELLKAALTTKMNFSEDKASKIIEIESEFFKAMGQANLMPVATAKEREEKEVKTHAAHVTRRAKLMAIPLTGRQMEDVIGLSEETRRKAGV